MCSSAVYGGTFNLFYKTLHEMGIDCTFVSPNCTEDELNAAFRENTRCVFAEIAYEPVSRRDGPRNVCKRRTRARRTVHRR